MIIYRGRTDGIIFEFLPPENKAKGVIMICEGMPSVPKQKELLSLLAENGYFVIFPRYRGTWESGGQFLKESPAEDVRQIIKLIKSGKVAELYAGKELEVLQKPIFLLGSSFGGSVALVFANDNSIDKIVAFSPIINFKRHNDGGNEQDLFWLGNFLHDAFGEAYRFQDEDFKRLIGGDLFNPPEEISPERAKKILILYDKSDREIDYKKIDAYAKKNSITTIGSENIGHLSFSKIPQETWLRIFEWLDKNS